MKIVFGMLGVSLLFFGIVEVALGIAILFSSGTLSLDERLRTSPGTILLGALLIWAGIRCIKKSR